MLTFNPLPADTPTPFGVRALTHEVAALPIAVLDGGSVAKRDPKGKAGPVVVALKDLSNPPPLLLGSEVELKVTFDPPFPPAELFQLDAEAKGKGLVTQTVIPDTESLDDEEMDTIIRIIASPKAETGKKPLFVTLNPKGGKPKVRELSLDVRAPFRLGVPAAPIVLAPGASATFHVDLTRESGFNGPVEVKLTDLPKGARVVAAALEIGTGEQGCDVRLEMDAQAAPVRAPQAFKVSGLARMPRGQVQLDSAIRPMVISNLAEK
jgi:hypothetical protein